MIIIPSHARKALNIVVSLCISLHALSYHLSKLRMEIQIHDFVLLSYHQTFAPEPDSFISRITRHQTNWCKCVSVGIRLDSLSAGQPIVAPGPYIYYSCNKVEARSLKRVEASLTLVPNGAARSARRPIRVRLTSDKTESRFPSFYRVVAYP